MFGFKFLKKKREYLTGVKVTAVRGKSEFPLFVVQLKDPVMVPEGYELLVEAETEQKQEYF